MDSITIAIVDDHPILSSGLRMLLEAEDDMRVVGQAVNAREAISVVQSTSPDCVLLDISLPDGSGLDLLVDLKRICPRTRVLILTMHDDRRYLQMAMERGAAGFLLKKAMDMDLIYAVRAVMRGECYIHPSLMKELLLQMDEEDPASSGQAKSKDALLWDSLSPREQEVMVGVARGYTSREIAVQCCLSEKTVATYRSRAMIKLGLENRASLVEFAKRLGVF